MVHDGEWRDLTETESLILTRMLAAEFSGVEQLREQARNLLVRTIDKEGSLALLVQSVVHAVVEHRIPVEASYSDSEDSRTDGHPRVHFLLHVIDGLMTELEVCKDDGSPIVRDPAVAELRLFTPSNWDNE